MQQLLVEEPTSSDDTNNDTSEVHDNDGAQCKKRGSTTMESIWNMTSNEKILVEVDRYGVPCTKEGGILGSFLGTIAKDGSLAPLNIPKWSDDDFKPFHRKMLSIVEERFSFPPETKKWILKSINKKWRGLKSKLKSKYFDNTTKTRKEIEAEVPPNVVPSQWPSLVKLWFNEQHQEMSQKNSTSAKIKKNVHTCGRKSYGRRRREMKNELGYSPDRLSFYDVAHKRKDGTYVDESVKQLMEKAFSLKSKRSKSSNGNTSEVNEAIFQEVMGKENNGWVRGLGLGPTPKSYFGVASYNIGAKEGSLSSSEGNHDIQSLNTQLQVMSKKYEEVCGKLKEVTGKYEDLSQTMASMVTLLSQKFPEQHWMQNKDINEQVNVGSTQKTADLQTDQSANSSNSKIA